MIPEEMSFLLKHVLWKLQLESWNKNYESLNRTLQQIQQLKTD